MRYSVNTLLIGLFVSVLMILFMFPVCSQSEETTGTVKITISSDDIRIYISDADNGDVHYTFSLEDIQYHYGEVWLHDNIVFNESGIVINGKRFPRDRLTSVTIEKNAGVLWNLIVNSDTDKLGDGVKKIKYSKSENDRWEFYDDLIIDNGEIIRGNVVNLFGDIEVYGWVEGDVVSIFGDVFIDSTGTTAKDVIAVNGDIITAPGAEIYGRQRTGTFGDDKESSKFYFGDRKKGYLSSDVKYNRVAGLDLAAETGFKDIKHELPEFYINGGYAFKLKRWHYDFGFRQQLLDRFAIIFGGNFYQLIDNNDEWIIKSEENSLAAFFIKEDFHDFFQREGYSAFVEQWLGYNNRFRFGYSVDSYELLEKHTNWSIFGTKKDFRENYSFVLPDSTGLREFNGDMKSIAINYELDTRERLYESVAGWYALLEWERAGYGLGGEFEFDRYWCIAQRLQPLTSLQYLNIRLVGGVVNGEPPLHKHFSIGGIGTLRGYGYKQFTGDRMLLLNIEYVVEFSNEISGIAFFDAGKSAYGKDAFNDEDFHSDIGLAVKVWRFLRVNFAKPIDTPDDDLRVTMRVSVPF